jgi:DNA-binding CsgD family transcriptional regulator
MCLDERSLVAQCVTCGSELHPERAKKYNYCMSPECQKKNLKGLTMVAVGVNKAAEQYLLYDEQTRDELASGKFHDQRRGQFGTSVPSSPIPTPDGAGPGSQEDPARPASHEDHPGSQAAQAGSAAGRAQAARRSRARPASHTWTKSQEKLALLYNAQGKRPEEIAQKLGLSTYTVTQIILTSRNRGKL